MNEKLLDNRYSFSKEFCGYSTTKIVLRFCGEFLGAFDTKTEALSSALEYEKDRIKLYNQDIQDTLNSIQNNIYSDNKIYC